MRKLRRMKKKPTLPRLVNFQKIVFLTVPNTGTEHVNLSHYIEQEIFNSGQIVIPNRQTSRPTDYSRNLCVNTFLNDPQGRQCEWFYTIDSDTVPLMIGDPKVPEGTLNRLLSHHAKDPEKKVLCGVTFSVSRGINWMPAMRELPTGLWHPDSRVYKQDTYPLCLVDGMGAACMMVHREVIEKVVERHGVCFRDHYDGYGHRILGQDLDFCRKVREQGYDIWVDLDVVCSHFKEVDLKDYTLAMMEHIKIFRMLSTAVDNYFGSIEEASMALFGSRETLDGLKEFAGERKPQTEGNGDAQARKAGRKDVPVAPEAGQSPPVPAAAHGGGPDARAMVDGLI